MLKNRILALVLLVAGVLIAWFVYSSEMTKDGSYKFKLGLDLNGGTELVYKADVSKLPASEVADSMEILRKVIENRVNSSGVTEATVQIEKVGLVGGENSQQLIVDLPGEKDINKAITRVGGIPLLEFRLQDDTVATSSITSTTSPYTIFKDIGLTGGLLKRSSVGFDSLTNFATVDMQFNAEGEQLFAKITKENIGKVLAIFLDGQVISMPTIKGEITGGKASITGDYSGSTGRASAKELVKNLNFGSLPVPIGLIATQTIGATLGESATNAAVKAGLIAFIFIALFLILWYRLPGFLAVLALAIYTAVNLALFKLIPGLTLTSAGIAGFILSVGMAVDANILIFERMKEELRKGRELGDAVKEGFARAWLSIRDSNTSSLITAVILYMFSSTSIIKGFALVFGIGVLVSMFTAITASRTLLLAIKHDHAGRFLKFMFGHHISSKKN